VIAANGVVLLRSTLFEMMDGGVQGEFRTHVRELAAGVDGVDGIEKCRIRKSGFGFLMDIHVEVDGRLSVEEGHEIARAVKHTLLDSGLGVVDVVVHIEPSPATIRGTAPPARTGPPPSP
jgi:divalent metal cation (Fe/Co/Zn/Cd) transporter